jgi:hypothetical protein
MISREQKEDMEDQDAQHGHTRENTNPANNVDGNQSPMGRHKNGAERQKQQGRRLTKFPQAVDMNRHDAHLRAGWFKPGYWTHLIWQFHCWPGVPKVITSGPNDKSAFVFPYPSWVMYGFCVDIIT